MSSPTSPTVTASTSDNLDTMRAERLSAAEHRADQDAIIDAKQLARTREMKQSFRRLIDPGIMRSNNKENAYTAIKTLVTLSENLLREPENPKFQHFKPTNPTIRKRLVDVKGAVEYAVALGFHLKVENFQPLYTFNARHMEELCIGYDVLKETFDKETERQERAQQAQLSEKELREIAKRNVQLNYEDDRREKRLKDEQEAQLRAARESQAASTPNTSAAPEGSSRIPLGGVTLSGRVEPNAQTILNDPTDLDNSDEE